MKHELARFVWFPGNWWTTSYANGKKQLNTHEVLAQKGASPPLYIQSLLQEGPGQW
jgi:hypothetical protein